MHLDVIVAVWDPAVAFLRQYGAELFPNVPVVFLTTAPPTPGGSRGRDDRRLAARARP